MTAQARPRRPAPRRLQWAGRPVESGGALPPPEAPSMTCWADVYPQRLDPLAGLVYWPRLWATLLAALRVVVLFCLLVPRRWPAPKAGAAAALLAILIAVCAYGMPWE